MATAEESLVARLEAIGSTAGTRIYPVKLPQSPTLPAQTFQRISTVRESGMEDSDIVRVRFQVMSWAATYTAARALAEETRAGLTRWSGTSATVEVLDVFNEGETDLFGDEENDADVFCVSQDYLWIHRE